MIENASIHNFRCFKSLQISGLKRINVVVGRNASGKTALLESIFLSAGPAPQTAFQLRASRQLGSKLEITAEASVYQSLWGDLFHWYDENTPIRIEFQGSNGDSRSLVVSYTSLTEQILPFGKQNIHPIAMPQINFEWKANGKPSVTVQPKITPGGIVMEGLTTDHFPVVFFGPHIADSPEETAKRFSDVSKAGAIEPVVEALKTEFPFVEALSIEYQTNVPTVHATIKGQQAKLPLGLVSDGVGKLVSILLGIQKFAGGAVLIDQFEDGFYFDRFPSTWRIINKFAKDNSAQLFVTTHSLECLRALLPIVKDNDDDFLLLRAERQNGSSQITPIEGRFLESALEQGFDVR